MYTDNKGKDIFRQFVSEMNTILKSREVIAGQNNETVINDLMDLECEFRDSLLTTKAGRDMYRQFMTFILEEKGNNLTCKPYFRERQDVFFQRILKIFESKRYHLLYRYRINFKFCHWVMQRYKGPKRKILQALYDQIVATRNQLCQKNLPLAIHQARIFFGKVNESRIDYMDLIQDASEGLLVAIDKHVPEEEFTLAKTASGKMGSQMIDDVRDSSLIKLSPRDKRILYRARNAERKEKLQSDDEVLEYVQESFKGVTKEELAALTNASQNVLSIDQGSDESRSIMERLSNDDNPERNALESDLSSQLHGAIRRLEPIEQKVVKLKSGV